MHTKTKSFWTPWLGCLLLGTVIAVGCSKGPPTGEVTGNILVNGVPAETGAISFFPVDGNSPTAGAEITNGKYTATVPVGKVKVEIRVSKAVGQQRLYQTPDSPVQTVWAEILPPKYNEQSILSMEVQEGTNEQDFNLNTN